MTLAQKAKLLDDQVRKMHLRNGFNASIQLSEKGNLSTGQLKDSDNDGLWTAMYLAGQAFRYVSTQDPEALANCKESLLAMERLYTVNPVEGFPSRSFERSGYIPQLADPDRWQHASDPEWDWKATTSSDEAMQQYITEKAMGYLAINQNAPVVVAGDKSVRYEEVILLMVALKKAGVPQVGLMTDPVN